MASGRVRAISSGNRGLSTRAIHSWRLGVELNGYMPVNPPVYRTAIFEFPGGGELRGRPVKYSREDNPTLAALEAAISSLEGGEDTLVFSTGMAALSTLLIALLQPGDRVVASRELYGTTLRLLEVLRRWGVEVVLAGPDSSEIAAEAAKPGTRLVLVETITNPLLHVTDVPEVVKAARESGAIVVVDNTFATPVLYRPLRDGATLVVHSLTKYMAGHNDVLGGSVTGPASIVSGTLWEYRRILGTTMDPEQAFLVLRGLKTLRIRVETHCRNAMQVAEFLLEHPKVREVIYPGLPNHPSHEVAKRLFPPGLYGGVVSFRIRGGREEALRFLSSLRVVKPAPSLGGPESLASYPILSSHSSMPEEERRRLGITEDLIRLSVGLEDVEDIIEDIDQALSRI